MHKRVLFLILILIISLPIFAQPRVGVALSGGGALGYAHIGALKALEEHGIQPVAVAGASMGALVGLLYANGLTADDIYRIIKEEHMDHTSKILTLSTHAHGLGVISHKNVYKILEEYVGHNNFDSLKLYYACSVTNLTEERSEIISSGDRLHQYVIASTSIPIVFEAVTIDSCVYVDGGVLNNMPAEAIRNQCDVLIGIDVVPDSKKGASAFSHIMDVAAHSLHLIINKGTINGRNTCDYLVTPNTDHTYSAFSFEHFEDIYLRGYNTMKAFIEANPEAFTPKITSKKENKKKKK